MVSEYFDNQKTMEGINEEHKVSYDKTNLVDYPQAHILIFWKGSKHTEHVINSSKTAVSIKFSSNATGKMLQPDIIYIIKNFERYWRNLHNFAKTKFFPGY